MLRSCFGRPYSSAVNIFAREIDYFAVKFDGLFRTVKIIAKFPVVHEEPARPDSCGHWAERGRHGVLCGYALG